jgi:hypothetical protein
MPLKEAIDAGAVRFAHDAHCSSSGGGSHGHPFDPIFRVSPFSHGRGRASLLLSRMTVPILYFLDKR